MRPFLLQFTRVIINNYQMYLLAYRLHFPFGYMRIISLGPSHNKGLTRVRSARNSDGEWSFIKIQCFLPFQWDEFFSFLNSNPS